MSMTFNLPFFNRIGRSLFGRNNDVEVKQNKIDSLRITLYDLNELKAQSESKGWLVLQTRCTDKIATLQARLERATPDELQLIQQQIHVLREVTDISGEMDKLAATVEELKELDAE